MQKNLNNHPISTPHRTAGFSLLEIAIVIAIIGLIVGMSVGAMQSTVQSARVVNTKEKIKAIDDALKTFWLVNKRLPCPADASLATNHANYGVEAANHNAGCTGGTPAANKSFNGYTTYNVTSGIYAAQGMLPFKALNLPESYASDGWGARLSYGVSAELTKDQSFYTFEPNTEYFPLRVSHNTFSTTEFRGAAYVLLSHGENGFGAYNEIGSVRTPSGATATEGANAFKDIATPFADTTYTGQYVYNSVSIDGTDDILSYTPLWQLYSGATDAPGLVRNRGSLFFSSTTAPYVYSYKWDGDGFIRETLPSTPSSAITGNIMTALDSQTMLGYTAFTGSNAGSSPTRCYYRKPDGTYEHYTSPCHNISAASKHLMAYHSLKNSSGSIAHVAFGGGATNNLGYQILGVNNTRISAINNGVTSTYAAGTINNLRFSPITGQLAVAHATTPYVSIYKRSAPASFPLTKLTDPANLPTGTGRDVAYSPDGRYLAVAHDTSPYVTIYATRGETYTKIKNPADLPTDNATGVSFSSDGRYLAVSHAASPYFTVYSIDKTTDTFTKLDNPSSLPSGTANDIDFACGEHKFAVAIAATSGNKQLMVYNIEHGELIVEATDIDTPPATGGTGTAVEFRDCSTTAMDDGLISAGLVARWQLNEGTGTTAADSSVNAYNGTLTNSPTWSSETPRALGSNSLFSVDFNGSSNYINTSSALGIAAGSDVTVTAWIYIDGMSVNNGASLISGGYGGDADGIMVYTSNYSTAEARLSYQNITNIKLYANGIEIANAVGNINSGEWVHVTVSGTVTDVDGGSHHIGQNNNNTNRFEGKIDDLRVYNRALSADEVARIAAGDG